LYVIKSRGMPHSNQVREFLITGRGVKLEDVYVGPEGVLTGSLRASQEAREKAARLARRQEIERKQRELEGRRAATRAQIAALEVELDAAELEAGLIATQDEEREQVLTNDRATMAKRRGGNNTGKARR
jgi:circadian clock protein KaiC